MAFSSIRAVQKILVETVASFSEDREPLVRSLQCNYNMQVRTDMSSYKENHP
jgi:hypothetical protein